MTTSEPDVKFDSMALSHSTLGAKSLVWVEHGHGQLLGGSTGLDLMQNIEGMDGSPGGIRLDKTKMYK